MGDGQAQAAEAAVLEGYLSGNWVLLQNCHLDLPLMERVELLLRKFAAGPLPQATVAASEAAASFRLFLTSEPISGFPAALLHRCIKVANHTRSYMLPLRTMRSSKRL